MDITQILLAAQSPDANLRTVAETNLTQFQEQNLPNFLLSLSVELSNDEKPPESRRLAGIILKNSLGPLRTLVQLEPSCLEGGVPRAYAKSMKARRPSLWELGWLVTPV